MTAPLPERLSAFCARRYRWLLAGTVLLSLAFSVCAHFDLRALDPEFDEPVLDSRQFLDWAKRIAGGDVLGSRVFFLNPLYPYFISPIVRLFPDPAAQLLAIRLLQALLGCATVLLVAGATRRFAGPGTAVLAAALTAVHPLLLYYEHRVMIVTLAVFLNALTLRLLARFAARLTLRAAALAGLPLGFGLLARPNVGLFAVLLPLWFLTLVPRAGRIRFAVTRTLAFGIVAALPLVPVALRNYAVGRDFVPITYSAGINLWQTNNPKAWATGWMVSDEVRFTPRFIEDDAVRLAERELGRTLKPSEVSRFWSRKAWKLMAEQPGPALTFWGRKFLLFLRDKEIPSSYFYEFEMENSFFLRHIPIDFALLATFAILGTVLAFTIRRSAMPWALLFIAYAAGLTIFYPLDHYRAPVLPAVIPLAAMGILHPLSCAALRRFGALVAAVLVLALAGALTHAGVLLALLGYPDVDVQSGDRCIMHYNQGLALLGDRRLHEAERAFRRSLQYDPNSSYPYAGLAEVARFRNELATEFYYLQKAIECRPDDPRLHAYMGRNLAVSGHKEGALEAARIALDLSPRDEVVRVLVGLIYKNAGMLEESLSEYDEALRLGFADPGIYADMASCLRGLKRYDEALELVERGLAKSPMQGALRLERALAHLARGTGDPAQIREDLQIAREAGLSFIPDLSSLKDRPQK